MDSAMVLKALEKERQLLQDFIGMSEDQLLSLELANIKAANLLLEKRADLMMEMTAIEATLGTWIEQIRHDAFVTPDVMRELRAVNDEIVSMARCILDIDEETHARLHLIKTAKTGAPRMDSQCTFSDLYAEAYKPRTGRNSKFAE